MDLYRKSHWYIGNYSKCGSPYGGLNIIDNGGDDGGGGGGGITEIPIVPVGNSVFVDSVFGQIGDVENFTQPYLNIDTAADAAETLALGTNKRITVFVRPGTYMSSSNLARNNVNWYFEEGTVVNAISGQILFDSVGMETGFDVRGYGEFTSDSAPGIFRIGNNVFNSYFSIEGKSASITSLHDIDTSVITVNENPNLCTVKFDKVFISNLSAITISYNKEYNAIKIMTNNAVINVSEIYIDLPNAIVTTGKYSSLNVRLGLFQQYKLNSIQICSNIIKLIVGKYSADESNTESSIFPYATSFLTTVLMDAHIDIITLSSNLITLHTNDVTPNDVTVNRRFHIISTLSASNVILLTNINSMYLVYTDYESNVVMTTGITNMIYIEESICDINISKINFDCQLINYGSINIIYMERVQLMLSVEEMFIHFDTNSGIFSLANFDGSWSSVFLNLIDINFINLGTMLFLYTNTQSYVNINYLYNFASNGIGSNTLFELGSCLLNINDISTNQSDLSNSDLTYFAVYDNCQININKFQYVLNDLTDNNVIIFLIAEYCDINIGRLTVNIGPAVLSSVLLFSIQNNCNINVNNTLFESFSTVAIDCVCYHINSSCSVNTGVIVCKNIEKCFVIASDDTFIKVDKMSVSYDTNGTAGTLVYGEIGNIYLSILSIVVESININPDSILFNFTNGANIYFNSESVAVTVSSDTSNIFNISTVNSAYINIKSLHSNMGFLNIDNTSDSIINVNVGNCWCSPPSQYAIRIKYDSAGYSPPSIFNKYIIQGNYYTDNVPTIFIDTNLIDNPTILSNVSIMTVSSNSVYSNNNTSLRVYGTSVSNSPLSASITPVAFTEVTPNFFVSTSFI